MKKIRNISLFNGVKDNTLDILKPFIIKTFDKKQCIYMPKDTVNTLDVLLEGVVAIRHLEADGRTMIVQKLNPDDIISLNQLFSSNNHYAMMVEAFSNVTMLSVPKQTVIKGAQADEAFMLNVLQAMSKRSETLVGKIKDQSLTSLEERVKQYLLSLYHQQGKTPIVLPDTKQAIAEELATARSSFVRTLMKMRDKGLLHFTRQKVWLESAFFSQTN